MTEDLTVGDRVVVEAGAVAHGGHCVARHEGRVLFVRHALPGEAVRVVVTDVGRRGRFLRADVVEVLVASPDRRPAPCPVAGTCGGCDWQHTTVPAARALKAQVVREALGRFAGVTLPPDFRVEAVADQAFPTEDDGLGWRTRGTLSVDATGRAGFLAHRSHEVVVAGQCLQLHPRLAPLDMLSGSWPPSTRVGFVAPSAGEPSAFPSAEAPPGPVAEWAAGRTWAVAADGFWQVHPGAADVLVGHVRRMLEPTPDDAITDLYAGVGLFGLSLVHALPDARLTLVEGDRRACELARRNAAGRRVRVVRADVARWVGAPRALAGTDLVVLDPPRTGAGGPVTGAIASAGPRAVAYVACDPVALARDVATFGELGYRLQELVALDLFPTTHHVECVALITPV